MACKEDKVFEAKQVELYKVTALPNDRQRCTPAQLAAVVVLR